MPMKTHNLEMEHFPSWPTSPFKPFSLSPHLYPSGRLGETTGVFIDPELLSLTNWPSVLLFFIPCYFCFIDYAKAFDCVDHNKLWKILQEMGIPDHVTCLLRNLYAGQETTVRTGHGTTDWFQIGKGVRQGCILSPCYLTYMQSTSWEMLGWKKHKLESRLLGEISITSDRQMTPSLWQKVKRN